MTAWALRNVADFDRVIGRDVSVRKVARRAGNSASVIANSCGVREAPRWRCKFDRLYLILQSELEWERKRFRLGLGTSTKGKKCCSASLRASADNGSLRHPKPNSRH
jgi:hypothetical protein